MDSTPNILLIRLKSIGDILFLLPSVHRLRENFPGARITFLTSRENAPLMEGFREVNEVITLDRARFQSGNPGAILAEAFSLLRRLRRGKFSLVVDFQGYGETAWLAWLSGAPQRWGSVYGPGRRWAYTRGVTRNDDLQIADWNLSLLEQCGLKPGSIRNEFVLPAGALGDARCFFAAQKLDSARPTLFIQPFTSTPKKNWPLENYLALASHWRALGFQIIFGGGPMDHATLEPARHLGFPTSAGVPILTSAGIAKLSTLVVGGVTGLLHLAVALQTRTVMLVGYPDHEPGFPYQHRDWAVTSPAGGHVSEIQTGTVIEACARAIGELGAAK
jgi:ADP-heptose:LPS heptosyltransferase